jgi:hypothetical protein
MVDLQFVDQVAEARITVFVAADAVAPQRELCEAELHANRRRILLALYVFFPAPGSR